MTKLLFTGASGFLGYNIRPILEKSYDVHTIGLTDDDDIKFNMAKDVPPINTHYDVVLHARLILCQRLKQRNRCFMMSIIRAQ
jgi:nucleoside-diphosphate-sugar epimerase